MLSRSSRWKVIRSKNGLVYVQEGNCPIAFVVDVNEGQASHAHLMASAPDLLDACKEALEALAGTGRADEMKQVADPLRAAIAKAETPSSTNQA